MASTTTRWICAPCGYVYDQQKGDPDHGIKPGTKFSEIPDDWVCPICGLTKPSFRPYAGQ